MDAVLGVTGADAPEADWNAALTAFWEQNESCHAIGQQFGQEKREKLHSALVSALTRNGRSAGSWASGTTLLALRALRVCSRHREGRASIETEDVLLLLRRLADKQQDDVASESLTVLGNLLLHNQGLTGVFVKTDGVTWLVDMLQSLAEDAAPRFLRVVLRVLLIATVHNEPLSAQLRASGACTTLASVLAGAVSAIDQLPVDAMSCKPAPDQPTVVVLLAEEVLKVMFNLTMDLGLLNQANVAAGQEVSKGDIDAVKPFIPLVRTLILKQPCDALAALQQQATNLLVNMPEACTKDLLGDREGIEAVVRVFDYTLARVSEDDAQGCMVSMVIVLTAVARRNEAMRQMMCEHLIPEDDDADPIAGVAVKEDAPSMLGKEYAQRSSKEKLLSHMTSSSMAWKHYVSEFLFALCDDSPDEFVARTGFGNAAGMLAEKGLFGVSSQPGAKAEVRHYTEEEYAEEQRKRREQKQATAAPAATAASGKGKTAATPAAAAGGPGNVQIVPGAMPEGMSVPDRSWIDDIPEEDLDPNDPPEGMSLDEWHSKIDLVRKLKRLNELGVIKMAGK